MSPGGKIRLAIGEERRAWGGEGDGGGGSGSGIGTAAFGGERPGRSLA